MVAPTVLPDMARIPTAHIRLMIRQAVIVRAIRRVIHRVRTVIPAAAEILAAAVQVRIGNHRIF